MGMRVSVVMGVCRLMSVGMSVIVIVRMVMGMAVVVIMVVAVPMGVIVGMIVGMIVSTVVLMLMTVCVRMARGVRGAVIAMIFQMNHELGARDLAAFSAFDVEMVSRQVELLEFVFQCVEIESEVDHGPQEHVAADAAEDIEIQSFH